MSSTATKTGNLVLGGQPEGETCSFCMGTYVPVKRKTVNGRGVWQREGGADMYLFYGNGGHWLVGKGGEHMKAAKGRGWYKAKSAAQTPDLITEAWCVADGAGGWLPVPAVSVVKERAQAAPKRVAPPGAATPGSKRVRANTYPAAPPSLAAMASTMAGLAAALGGRGEQEEALRRRVMELEQGAKAATAATEGAAAREKELADAKEHFKQEVGDLQDEKKELALFIDRKHTEIDALKASNAQQLEELVELRAFKERARALVLAQ